MVTVTEHLYEPATMNHPSSKGTQFTYDQCTHFALLMQLVPGMALRFVPADDSERQEETIPLPNDVHLKQALQRLRDETSSSTTLHLQVAGTDIQVTRSHEDASDGDAFTVTIFANDEKISDSQGVREKRKTHEYRVFDDYQTSFVWAASSDGLNDPVSDDELHIIFTPLIADALKKWTNAYNNSFSRQKCDQGSGRDVFPTVAEIVIWMIEGAVLSARIAAFTSPIPVVYSAYLREGKEYRFVGDPVKDGRTLVDLVVRMDKHLSLEHPSNAEFDGILGLVGSEK